MFNKIKKILIITTGLSSLMALTATPALVFADASVDNSITSGICTGVDNGSTGKSLSLNPSSTAGATTGCINDQKAGNTLGNLISEVINIMSVLVGAICVIMIIVGGFRYVTSGGESNSVSGAKNTIIYAIVGLVIVALAQIIVHFVLSRLNGTIGAGS
jgi:hypothetical protein